MKEVIRIWLFKTDMGLKYPEARPSQTNKQIVKEVRGEFKYYSVDGNNIVESTRAEADQFEKNSGRKVKLYRGYPSFMFDKGYRY